MLRVGRGGPGDSLHGLAVYHGKGTKMCSANSRKRGCGPSSAGRGCRAIQNTQPDIAVQDTEGWVHTISMELYSQHRRFVASTWLLLLAGFGFAFQGAILVLLLAVLWPGGYSWPPKWWTVSFLSAVGWLIVTGCTGVLLAAFMKCDACGRRPTLVWDPRYKEPYANGRGFPAISNFLIAPELRRRTFQCAHCRREFSLHGYQGT
jgi:hypothetical protein